MAKINDTTDYANTVPAAADHVIGTDVSNTTNDANGETVTFLMSAIKTFMSADQAHTGDASFVEITETQYSLTGTVIDPANGTIQYKTLSANTTFTESLVDGQSVLLMIDDGAARTITWPTITWLTSDGSAPTLATTGYNAIQLFQMNGVLYGKDIRVG